MEPSLSTGGFPSEDGKYVAYGTSASGSEESTLRVIEVDSGKPLSDTIERTRFASVEWKPDSSGFYYSRHPKKRAKCRKAKSSITRRSSIMRSAPTQPKTVGIWRRPKSGGHSHSLAVRRWTLASNYRVSRLVESRDVSPGPEGGTGAR